MQFSEFLGIMPTASSWRSLEIELATQANVDTTEMLPWVAKEYTLGSGSEKFQMQTNNSTLQSASNETICLNEEVNY